MLLNLHKHVESHSVFSSDTREADDDSQDSQRLLSIS